MAKLLYSAAMSLDGFIAGPDGDMQWLAQFMGSEDKAAAALPGGGGGLLGGRRRRCGGGWHGPQFVPPHAPPDESLPSVEFVDALGPAIAKARAAAGERYVCVIGAEVARGCLEAGGRDEGLG